MSRIVIVCLTCSTVAAQVRITPEKLERYRERVDEACDPLNQNDVKRIKGDADRRLSEGQSKGAAAREGRREISDAGLEKDYEKCLIAHLRLREAEQELKEAKKEKERLKETWDSLTRDEQYWLGAVVIAQENKIKILERYVKAARRDKRGKDARKFLEQIEYYRNIANAHELVVLDPKTLTLGEIGFVDKAGRIDRVLKDSVLLDFEVLDYSSADDVVFKGVDTTGMVDDKLLAIPGIWKITGTQDIYGRVFVAERVSIDLDKIQTIAKAAQK